jgi:hypothetical protein
MVWKFIKKLLSKFSKVVKTYVPSEINVAGLHTIIHSLLIALFAAVLVYLFI